MIDYSTIGARIKEQRKYIMKVSQEKMAEDLMMYQADISNLEKAKSGSGITDLAKLELIADYFGIPLETLLFGREGNNMMKYYGDTMKIVPSNKKIPKTHKDVLLKLTGYPKGAEINPTVFECGPYSIYSMMEMQYELHDENSPFPVNSLQKMHTYVFLGSELVALMVADITTVMQHVFHPALIALQKMIQPYVLDVIDCWRTLNPYWALWHFSSEEECEQYTDKMYGRMQELRDAGEKRPILYVENIYVREDCRQHGLFRMYIDYLKLLNDGCIIWLNMEPTNGSELDQEYEQVPSYTISDLGQLSLNAAIAEKVGFTIDPDTWHRQVEKIDDNGNHYVETALVRKCAYYLPAEIRKIIVNDGDLVAKGRALQRVQISDDAEKDVSVEMHEGMIDGNPASEVKVTVHGGKIYFCTAIRKNNNSWRFVVSHNSLIRDEREWIIEEFTSVEEALDSEYYEDIMMAAGLAGYDSDALGYESPKKRIRQFDPASTFDKADGFTLGSVVEIKVSNASRTVEIHEAPVQRNNDSEETFYAAIYKMPGGDIRYSVARKSMTITPVKADMKFLDNIDIVEMVNEEEVKESRYLPIYVALLKRF